MNASIILERALPLSKEIMTQLQSGELTLHGGVLRSSNGQIFKHLIFPPEKQEEQLLKQQLTNIPPSSANAMLESQMLGLAAVNIIAVKAAMKGVEQKLAQISMQLDSMQTVIDDVLELSEFHAFVTVHEIEGGALAAIEEALIAAKTVDDERFLRLHFKDIRKSFVRFETMLSGMMNKMDNLTLVKNIEFFMMLSKLFNISSTILCQLHIKLEEDDIAAKYLERTEVLNNKLLARLRNMQATQAFSPHIISRDMVEKFKSDVMEFKSSENTVALLHNQNQLCLEHKISHQELLTVNCNQILMLDPGRS